MSIIETPAASTGSMRMRMRLVRSIDHTNRWRLRRVCPLSRPMDTVTIMLMAFRMEDHPRTWMLRMRMSTAIEVWKSAQERVGYMVQPVPTPSSIYELTKRRATPKT